MLFIAPVIVRAPAPVISLLFSPSPVNVTEPLLLNSSFIVISEISAVKIPVPAVTSIISWVIDTFSALVTSPLIISLLVALLSDLTIELLFVPPVKVSVPSFVIFLSPISS